MIDNLVNYLYNAHFDSLRRKCLVLDIIRVAASWTATWKLRYPFDMSEVGSQYERSGAVLMPGWSPRLLGEQQAITVAWSRSWLPYNRWVHGSWHRQKTHFNFFFFVCFFLLLLGGCPNFRFPFKKTSFNDISIVKNQK